MLRKAAAIKKVEQRICVVCKELVAEDILNEDVICAIALAQRLALAGNNVTILWVPKQRPSAEEIETTIAAYRDSHKIKVDLYEHVDETIYKSNLANHVSLGVYTYLKKHDYSVAYIPLEGGMAYYTLLGKETGVYSSGPQIRVIATAPQEWSFNADRFFYWSVDQLKIDFMEKYCAQQADTLICTSTPLHEWMKKQDWQLSPHSLILPALSPTDWNEQPYNDSNVPTTGAREIILVASPHFRDGITLFCDVLDHLNSLTSENLTITVLGGFYRILGEHTGGMFVRRGRRWKFRLRFLRDLTLRQGLLYAKEVGAIAVIPNFENAGGYGVAECIRLGIPFVATNVGGNVEQVSFFNASHNLAKPEPKILAASIVERLKKPVPSLTRKFEVQKFQLWLKLLSGSGKGVIPLNKKSRRKSSSPLVSVIMTHHDRPQFFLQALESIREQDYPNFEVIVVDDGSSLPESHAMLDGLKSE
jgi:hypothetical protein